MGVTVVPALSVPREARPVDGPPQDGPRPLGGQPSYSLGVGAGSTHLAFVPFSDPVPTRRVVLAWRRSFTRYEAIAALRNSIYACKLDGVERLS
jgi:LysR family hydrogen peroxide-inducible transcriptional activator